MTTEQIEAKKLRRELVQDAGDPFAIAALAVARNRQLERRVQELEALLRR